ncbi:Mobile element protein [uncultured Candidatus Thioglobus sp.]|nr:Mobile element protein [uncultured Candidatus Thioglobus sp.]
MTNTTQRKERVNFTIEQKLNYQSFANHQEAVENVESYIYFYNYKRIHLAIGYLTPAQKMAE